MSPADRPKGEYRGAKHAGAPVNAATCSPDGGTP